MAAYQNYDPEIDSLQSQVAMAQALRKKAQEPTPTGSMVGPHFVEDRSWQWNPVKDAMGALQENYANKQIRDVQDQRAQETAAALRDLPTATTKRPTWTPEQAAPQATGGGGAFSPLVPEGQETVNKTPQEYFGDLGQYGAKIAPSRNPQLQQLGGNILQKTMLDYPMSMAEAQLKGDEISHYETDPTTGAVTGYTKTGKTIPLGGKGKTALLTPHYETDDSGNVTAITHNPDGSYKKEKVGAFGKTKTQAVGSGSSSPEGDALLAKAIIEGRVDPTKVNSRNRKDLIAALTLGPTANLNDLTGLAGADRARELEYSPKGISGRSIVSINRAVEHLSTLGNLGAALKNGDTRSLNTIGNAFEKQFGADPVTNFNSAKQIVASEIIRSIVPGGGGVSERQDLAKQVEAASSPEQLQGFINTSLELMAGQLKGLEQGYAQGDEGRVKRFQSKLLPKSIDALSKHLGNTPAPTAPAAVAPKQLSPADAEALAWAQSNPNDPNAAKTKIHLGVK